MADKDDELNQLFRAVSDTTRRRIIDELAKREQQSLFEVCARLASEHRIGHSRQALSRHIGVLEEAGLIDVEWKGTTKLHTLNTKPLARLQEGWITKFKEQL